MFAMAKILFVLGLAAAAFCIVKATRPGDSLVPVPMKLKVDVNNKCNIDVDLTIHISGKVHKRVHCKNHRLTTVGPIDVKVNVFQLLNCEVLLFDKKGKQVKLNLTVNLKLAHIIAGVKQLALTLVEDVAEGVVKILCGPILIAKIKL